MKRQCGAARGKTRFGTIARLLGSFCIACSAFAAQGTELVSSASSLPARPAPTSPASPRASAPAPEPEPMFAAPTRLDRTGRILAPVMINGQGPYRMIVDTGASHSTLSSELAQALGLVPSDEYSLVLNGVTGTARVQGVLIERLQAGDISLKRARIPVVTSALMAGADGVLGIAGLDTTHIYVDFRKDRVVITRKSKDELHPSALIHGTRIRDGLFAIDARVLRVRALAIIDTGAERSLGNLALRDAVRKQLKEADGMLQAAEVTGVTTDIAAGEAGAAPPITIGNGVKVDNIPVTYGDFHIFKVWNLEKRPAMIIGMDVLGLVDAFEIDFSKAQMRIMTRNMRD
ncbi:MAG TPA: retropepsin-like aspartic protease [Steroidobacteraceae bacterium]|nr:retropepsin-like aspartic protease [Steroidobacteraceae bacterium]